MATISNTTDESRSMYTIDYLMRLEGISEFELLKADIEGAEFDIIPSLLDLHKPAQLYNDQKAQRKETYQLYQLNTPTGGDDQYNQKNVLIEFALVWEKRKKKQLVKGDNVSISTSIMVFSATEQK
ncbi:hypothetical protein KIN20_016707 [Parelaphostrongylus tenuis]|uniref:Methyltransferase FkbM domain-containing protein n=1 Tax=Parelaphostrongylus tenuis TaxID=148309 RepID=A0AAD5MGU9_PARTN|nr:hypothetical protein KIN20_016707 [Parelaphostrongylus tenuis]